MQFHLKPYISLHRMIYSNELLSHHISHFTSPPPVKTYPSHTTYHTAPPTPIPGRPLHLPCGRRAKNVACRAISGDDPNVQGSRHAIPVKSERNSYTQDAPRSPSTTLHDIQSFCFLLLSRFSCKTYQILT